MPKRRRKHHKSKVGSKIRVKSYKRMVGHLPARTKGGRFRKGVAKGAQASLF